MRDHKYYFEELVLGNSLSAVTYSLIKNVPLVFAQNAPPHPFEFFDPKIDLCVYGSENSNREMSTPSGFLVQGKNKLEIWNKTVFKLALKGLILFPFDKDSVRIEDKSRLNIIWGNSRVKISFNILRVFDGRNIKGLQVEYGPRHQVIDWINVGSGAKQKKQIDIIRIENNFVNEVYFYPSKRSRNSSYRDCVAISYLTPEELMKVEYTDTFAKFEVRKLMKEAGLKGTANGFYDQYPKKERHYDIRLDPVKREINKVVKKCYTLEQNNKIVFDFRNEEEVINGE